MAGPCVSIMMPTETCRTLAAARMSRTTRLTQSCGACDMLSRKTLTPESMSWPIISDESVAGPSVAMILVRLMLGSCGARVRKTVRMKRVYSTRSRPILCHSTESRPWKWGLIFDLPASINQSTLTPRIMADIANKYPENVAGKFYVDNQCIDCDLCRETAPNNFKRNDDGGYSFVYKQPSSPEEEAQCKEAKEGCPVEAIGDDGDQA